MSYSNIVWDWNGTLLNDLQAGVDTLGEMLERHGRQALTVDEYKRMFGFPVADFYERIGFSMAGYALHEVSVEFVETYERHARGVQLNAGVREVLETVRQSGRRQYILSALREDLLRQMTADFGIDVYFDALCGSDNIYAAGKVERGRRMLKECRLTGQTLMVGDTEHDAEVAQALGFDCVLFDGGHNDRERLRKKAPVISSLAELVRYY